MPWYIYATLAPMLWAMVNHFDKYVITKYIKGGDAGSSILFSGLSGFVVSLIVFFIFPHVFSVSVSYAFLMALNGALLTAAFIPYLYALGADETSIVAPLFQLVAVFIYIFGAFFLGEHLSGSQLLAGLLIIGAAIMLSLNVQGKTIRIKKKVVGLMVLSSLMIAVNSLIFKVLALDTNFWTTAFWEYLGTGIFSLLLFFLIPKYRREFMRVMKKHAAEVLSLNIIGEIISSGARLSFNFAALLVPVALVSIVNGFQPVLILVYGTILTVCAPHIAKENINKHFLAQKIVAILVMCVGAVFLVKG